MWRANKKFYMKIFTWIFDKTKIFSRFLSNNLPVFVAIAALVTAIVGINNLNKQFKINSKTADSLFNMQLKHSKELNDSLINQISILQDITNKQLQITDEQLKISTENLQDQIYSGRPKIAVISNKITDTIKTLDYIFKPRIVTVFKNVGKRFANEVSIRTFTVVNNLSNIQANLDKKESFLFEPDVKKAFQAMPEFHQKYKDDFYYCYDFIYYDKILKQEFSQSYYLRYFNPGDKYHFVYCNIDETEKIKESINNWLRDRQMNDRLFDK